MLRSGSLIYRNDYARSGEEGDDNGPDNGQEGPPRPPAPSLAIGGLSNEQQAIPECRTRRH